MVLAAAAAISVDAFAGPLAPSKPSQIVTVLGGVPGPNCLFAGTNQVNILAKPDGGTETFIIPPKSVFVATSFEWSSNVLTSGHSVTMTLLSVGQFGSRGAQTSSTAIVGTNGRAGGFAIIPNGLIVKPPATLCMSIPFGTAFGFVQVHGFFAKDN